jgi:hypothetical protein
VRQLGGDDQAHHRSWVPPTWPSRAPDGALQPGHRAKTAHSGHFRSFVWPPKIPNAKDEYLAAHEAGTSITHPESPALTGQKSLHWPPATPADPNQTPITKMARGAERWSRPHALALPAAPRRAAASNSLAPWDEPSPLSGQSAQGVLTKRLSVPQACKKRGHLTRPPLQTFQRVDHRWEIRPWAPQLWRPG